MWSDKVAAVASLGLVPAYRWIQRRRAARTTQGAEREAYKPGAAPAETGAVRMGGAAAGFAPGEPMARPAVESEREVFQPEMGKDSDLPILLSPFPTL